MKQANLSHQEDVIGRSYMLGKDLRIKYDDKKEVLRNIKQGLAEFVFADPAIRFVLNNSNCNPVRTILGLPFEAKKDEILENFADLMCQSLMGYYLQGDNQTTHFGLSDAPIEGGQETLLRREIERLIDLIPKRGDLAGRLMRKIKISEKIDTQKVSSNLISETIRSGLEIHVGYRIFIRGEDVNSAMIFIPIEENTGVVEQIFQNLEEMLQRAFNVYDEIGSGYLELTENLIFKDLESILSRSKEKEFTRKKILNKLVFDVFADKGRSVDQKSHKDIFYQMISNNDNSEIEGVSRYFASNFDSQRAATAKKRAPVRKKKEVKDTPLSAGPDQNTLGNGSKNGSVESKEDGGDISLQKESIQELKE